MKIGIIGSGEVAQSLGKGLTTAGHQVMLGDHTGDMKELKAWQKHAGKRALIGSSTEAASYSELAFLATAWHAAEDVLQQIRPELAGKIVIDVTNPLIFDDNSPPTLAFGHDMSGGEIVQQSLPDSHVVKTLNFINHEHMIHPKYKEGTPMMLLCGNNLSAKGHVQTLLQELGWDQVTDLGNIEKCRLLEPLCLLWIEYGLIHDSWDHALTFLAK